MKASSANAAKTDLQLVWLVNGEEMSNRPVSLTQGEATIEYRNRPEAGIYRIKLMSGTTTRAETTFTIKRTVKNSK